MIHGVLISFFFLNLFQGSLYNVYADDLLDLQLFPETVRDKQDRWYYHKTGPQPRYFFPYLPL
jgi:Domain of unknown function (DUF1793)